MSNQDTLEELNLNESENIEELRAIAATNEISIPWSELRIMLNQLIAKQSRVVDPKIIDINVRNEVDKIILNISRVLGALQDCPFTIQRACELIVDPGQHYKSYIKYLRAFEKIITVTSSWKAFTNTSINQHSADRISTPFIFDDVQIPTEPLDSGEERMETEEPSKINGTHENIDKVVDESKEGKNQQMEIAETTGGTVN